MTAQRPVRKYKPVSTATHPSVTRASLIRDMARMAFVAEWASLQDRLHEDGKRYTDPGPGGNWYDVAPRRTPTSATTWAKKAASKIEALNHDTLLSLFARDAMAAGGVTRKYPTTKLMATRWAESRALEVMGHGVSWNDDYDSDAEMPYYDYNL